MNSIDALLERIPDIDVDLNRCSAPGALGLPPPVVVTLERRPDRWERARAALGGRDIDRIIKAPAIDGSALEGSLLRSLLADAASVDQPLKEYLQLTRPAVGCFLSHLAIWKRFLQSGESRVLIMEDDAVPADGLTADTAQRALSGAPASTHMLLLGCTVMDGLAEPTADPRFTRIYYYNGTYGYLLTRPGCMALLPRMLPVRTHIDNQISLELVANASTLRVLAVEPRLIEHDFTVRSDVYLPVMDTSLADRTLAAIFTRSRARLIGEGAKLLPAFTQPTSMPSDA